MDIQAAAILCACFTFLPCSAIGFLILFGLRWTRTPCRWLRCLSQSFRVIQASHRPHCSLCAPHSASWSDMSLAGLSAPQYLQISGSLGHSALCKEKSGRDRGLEIDLKLSVGPRSSPKISGYSVFKTTLVCWMMTATANENSTIPGLSHECRRRPFHGKEGTEEAVLLADGPQKSHFPFR